MELNRLDLWFVMDFTHTWTLITVDGLVAAGVVSAASGSQCQVSDRLGKAQMDFKLACIQHF